MRLRKERERMKEDEYFCAFVSVSEIASYELYHSSSYHQISGLIFFWKIFMSSRLGVALGTTTTASPLKNHATTTSKDSSKL